MASGLVVRRACPGTLGKLAVSWGESFVAASSHLSPLLLVIWTAGEGI